MSKKARPDSDLHPRPEAGPLACSALTKSQLETAQQVLRLLAGMAKASPLDVQYEQDLIRIDPIRHNRTILIDGARGSGKTTLLISLLDALQRRFGQRTDPRHPNEEQEDWANVLTETTGSALIVPVSLVDLAPLPRRSNLMMLLISCLETIVKRIESASHGVSTEQRAQAALAPFCHDGEQPLASRERWNDLATATILGWDDHATKRTPPSDLESYAREQMTAEQQRLDLSNLIDRFLSALHTDFRDYLQKSSKDKRRSRNEEPVLFLIAVDDADMNPGRVAELLDALRLLGHRQLAFLLTGDKRLFLDSLQTWCLNALGRENADATGGGQNRVQRCEQLAAQIYDKLIPTTHHFRILNPANDTTSVVAASSRFHSYLTACPFLCAALPKQLRAVQNLRLFIDRSVSGAKDTDDATLGLAEYLFGSAASEWGYSTARERFGSVLLENGALEINVPASVAARSLVTTFGTEWTQLPPPVQRTQYFTKAALPEVDSQAPESAMTAALMLAALTVMAQRAGILRVLSHPSLETQSRPGAEISFIEVALRLNLSADRSFPRSFVLGWPIPKGLALHEQVLLYYCWKSRVDAEPDRTERTIVAKYLGAICAMGDMVSTSERLPVELPNWGLPEIAARVANAATTDMDNTASAELGLQDWAQHGAVLLGAPEYGLSAEAANDLLYELRRAFGPRNWFALRDSMSLRRKERIIEGVGKSGGLRIVRGEERSQSRLTQAIEIIAYIDRTLEEYDWALLVEDSRLRKALLSANLTVSDATLMLLEQGSAKWLRQLLDGIKLFVEKNAPDRKLSESLHLAWRATGQPTSYAFASDETSFGSLAEEASDLVLSRLRSALQSDRLPPGKLLANGRTHETQLAISVSFATLPAFQSTDGKLSPLQEGLLHLLWDDQSDGPVDVPLTAMKEWPSIALTIDTTTEQIVLSWPSARWRTFAAAGAVTVAWNQAVEFLRRPGHRAVDGELLDLLAFFYIRCCISAATSSSMPTHLPENAPPERDWSELLEQMVNGRAPSSLEPLRFRSGIAIAELWLQVPLLAMPESGLSFAGVRAIIRFLQERDKDHHHLQSALKLRRARLTTQLWTERESSRRDWQECQAAAERILEYLEKIARNVDHPFQVWLDTTPKLQEMLKTL